MQFVYLLHKYNMCYVFVKISPNSTGLSKYNIKHIIHLAHIIHLFDNYTIIRHRFVENVCLRKPMVTVHYYLFGPLLT